MTRFLQGQFFVRILEEQNRKTRKSRRYAEIHVMRQFFEANCSLNIFQISSWGVCIKFKVLIILVWLRGRAQNDDKLTNAKLYPPHVDFIKKTLWRKSISCSTFSWQNMFFIIPPTKGSRSEWNISGVWIWLLCTSAVHYRSLG